MNKSYAFIAIDSASGGATFASAFVVLVALAFVLVALAFVLVALAFVVAFALVFALDLVAFGLAAVTSISSEFVSATACASIESASTLARSFALYLRFRGFVLNLYPQHGHQRPSHLMNISQI